MNHTYILLLRTEITNMEISLCFSYYSWAWKEQEPSPAPCSGLRELHLSTRAVQACAFDITQQTQPGLSVCASLHCHL